MIYVFLINVLIIIRVILIFLILINITESYELNGWERNFTVIDYEVYSVEY